MSKDTPKRSDYTTNLYPTYNDEISKIFNSPHWNDDADFLKVDEPAGDVYNDEILKKFIKTMNHLYFDDKVVAHRMSVMIEEKMI